MRLVDRLTEMSRPGKALPRPPPLLPRPTRNEPATNGPPLVAPKPTGTPPPVPANKPSNKAKSSASADYEKPFSSPGIIPVQKLPPTSQLSPVREPDTPDNFGFCLQSARDCINKRHDDELKALECFRAYMHKRAKADAEYAATLGKINSQTAREMAGVGSDSIVVQVWIC